MVSLIARLSSSPLFRRHHRRSSPKPKGPYILWQLATCDLYLGDVLSKRLKMFESIKARQAQERRCIGGEPITITLPDGTVRQGKRWLTTPKDVARSVQSDTYALVAKVNGVVWDMLRPLESDCQITFFSFYSGGSEGREAFWRSSAFLLGQSLEWMYGCQLCAGGESAHQEGFYCDASFGGDLELDDAALRQVEKCVRQAAAENLPFERIEVTREEALEMFAANKYKVELINEYPEQAAMSVYRCGMLVDISSGPHIPNTSFIKAFLCLKASGNKPVQRIWGISYPRADLLIKYISLLKKLREDEITFLEQFLAQLNNIQQDSAVKIK